MTGLKMRHPPIMLWFLLACVQAPDTGVSASDSEGDDTALEWLTLDVSCASDATGDDGVTLEEEWHSHFSEDSPEVLTEFIDVTLAADGRIWAVGQGGIYLFSDGEDGIALDDWTRGWMRYHHVGLYDEERLVLTYREQGLQVWDDLSGEPAIEFAARWLEGFVQVGERLWVVSRTGDVIVYEVSDDALVERNRVAGLSSPWDITLGDGYAYVADHDLGIVVVDASDPDNPVVGEAVALTGGAQDVLVLDDALYAGSGSAGVSVLDLSDRASPTLTEQMAFGSAVQGLALGEDRLWAVSQRDVALFDVRTPREPVLVGVDETDEFAMAVAAAGDTAWVGDWGGLVRVKGDLDVQAPSLRVSPEEVLLSTDAQTRWLTVANHGSNVLDLYGLDSDVDGLTAHVSTTSLMPGEQGSMRLSWDGGDAQGTLCLATSDPDQPTVNFDVYTAEGAENAMLGTEAPDFVLEDLDGNTHVLSEQRGSPVLIAYFTTW